jgi:hypothetical protein
MSELTERGKFFKTEIELFKHLIAGGIIRPHFYADKTDKSKWITLVGGNRVYLESNESAQNCLLGLMFWVAA